MTKPPAPSLRLTREAKALRDNLKRRKDQANARKALKSAPQSDSQPLKDPSL